MDFPLTIQNIRLKTSLHANKVLYLRRFFFKCLFFIMSKGKKFISPFLQSSQQSLKNVVCNIFQKYASAAIMGLLQCAMAQKLWWF